ncbi:MAG TPA: c-type cytochrome [Vicinamibacterales bacterium]
MSEVSYRSVAAIAAAAALCAIAGASGAQSAAQPPADVASQSSRGKSVYDGHCVECHGTSGKGDGPAAALLTPRPRDFTTAKFKIRTTETGSIPTDDDLIRSVADGLYGSAMPAWKGILPDSDIRDVVAYTKSLSTRFGSETPKIVALGPPIETSPEGVVRGQRVYEKLQCAACHGVDGRGTKAIATEFWDDWNQPLRATDLTEPWTFHGGAAPRDVYLRFRTGLAGTPMPSFVDVATDADMWDLANYVVSLGRKPIWSMDGPDVAALLARQDAEAKANPVRRGASLVDTLGCAVCHSPYDAEQRMLPGMRLAGGLLLRIAPFGDFPTGNLTADKDTGLGNWTDDEIKRTVTRGILKDGTRLLPYPMDWPAFSNLTPDDLNAIVAYLRTVPPVSNKVPAPRWSSFPVYMWGKFKLLMLGDDPPMLFFPGNYGTAGGRR